MNIRLSAVTGGGPARLLAVAALLAVAISAVVFGLLKDGDQQPSASADSANAPASRHSLGDGLTFIRIEGDNSGLFPGGSTRVGHQGWSEVISISESMVAPVDAATGLRTGKVRPSDVTITKPIDASSTYILMALATNEPLQQVEIDLLHVAPTGQQQVYLKYRLLNATITGRRISAGAGTGTETLTISYEMIEIESLENGSIGTFTRQTIS